LSSWSKSAGRESHEWNGRAWRAGAGPSSVAAVPRRLRPKTELAADAILVGDPGRSLLLAQELLVEPKMSNHARGLWGYTGRTPAGDELTIQTTGMGGPSAAVVLADLAKLGVKRVVRVGTCVATGPGVALGELLLPSEAIAGGGSAAAFGVDAGKAAPADGRLTERLREELLADAAHSTVREVAVESLDAMPPPRTGPPPASSSPLAADMQTVAVFARAGELGMAAAAVLIVSDVGEERLVDEALDETAKRAGRAAAKALSNPQVEG
jgi:uridine phosphorylase